MVFETIRVSRQRMRFGKIWKVLGSHKWSFIILMTIGVFVQWKISECDLEALLT